LPGVGAALVAALKLIPLLVEEGAGVDGYRGCSFG
jgi:hypothetical protein